MEDTSKHEKELLREVEYAEMDKKKAAVDSDRAFELEQRFLSTRLAPTRESKTYWINPVISELLEIMGQQLGQPKADVLEQAVFGLYRTVFSSDRAALSDMILQLDNLSLLVHEHTQEIINMEELAVASLIADKTSLDEEEK